MSDDDPMVPDVTDADVLDREAWNDRMDDLWLRDAIAPHDERDLWEIARNADHER